MDQLRHARPHRVHAEDLLVGRREDELQEAALGAEDLAAGVLAHEGAPDEVVDAFGLQFLLVQADVADLGDGVDAVGKEGIDAGLVGQVKRVAHRDPTLLHAGRSEAGKADHVAGRVDVRHRGLEMLVDGEVAALVRHDAERFQVEPLHVTAATGRRQHRRCRLDAAFFGGDAADARLRVDLALHRRVAQPQPETEPLELGGEPVADLGVEEAEQPIAPVHHRHVRAERSEDAGVLAGDDAGTEHDQGLRDGLDLEDLVGVVDLDFFERNPRRPVRPRSGGDQEHVRVEPLVAHFHGVRVDERRRAGIEVDLVAIHVARDAAALLADDEALAVHQRRGRVRPGQREHGRLQPARGHAGQRQRTLAQRLRGQRAGVGAGAAQMGRGLLDHRRALAEIRRLRRALLAGRPAADHDQVVHRHVHKRSSSGTPLGDSLGGHPRGHSSGTPLGDTLGGHPRGSGRRPLPATTPRPPRAEARGWHSHGQER